MAANKQRIEEVSKVAEGTRKEVRDQGRLLEEMEARLERKMALELREREARRLNLIMHGVPEQRDSITNNSKRMDRDKADCEKVFRAMGARTKAADLRFCRRIGEKGQNPRPIVFGVELEADRKHILNLAKELRNTNFECVTIVPDLTRGQRKDEQELREEADRLNEQLTTEDRNKNLKWIVVGRRGEKRLIKGTEREYLGGREERQNIPRGGGPPSSNTWRPSSETGARPRTGANERQSENYRNGELDMQERSTGEQQEVVSQIRTILGGDQRRDSWPALTVEQPRTQPRPQHPEQEQQQKPGTSAVRHNLNRQEPHEQDGTVDGWGRPRLGSKRGRDRDEWENEQPFQRQRR